MSRISLPRSSTPCLSVVVPFNGDEARFDATLASLLQHRYRRCEIVIAHDGSWDDRWSIADEEQLKTVVVDTREASASELIAAAVAVAQGDVVGICQPGIHVAAQWQPQILAAFIDPAVAAVSPTIVDGRRPDTIIAAGVTHDRRQNRMLVGEECRTSSTTAGRLNPIGPTIWSAFYRRSFLAAIGGVDTSVDAMYLDLDLALSVQALGLRTAWAQTCQVTPVGVMVAVRSRSWTRVWCLPQSNAKLLRSVAPFRDHHVTWWASHQVAGIVQPGKVHFLSRCQSRLICPGVASRVSLPWSMTSLSDPRTVGIRSAEQASWRTCPGDRVSPVNVRPEPMRASLSMS